MNNNYQHRRCWNILLQLIIFTRNIYRCKLQRELHRILCDAFICLFEVSTMACYTISLMEIPTTGVIHIKSGVSKISGAWTSNFISEHAMLSISVIQLDQTLEESLVVRYGTNHTYVHIWLYLLSIHVRHFFIVQMKANPVKYKFAPCVYCR